MSWRMAISAAVCAPKPAISSCSARQASTSSISSRISVSATVIASLFGRSGAAVLPLPSDLPSELEHLALVQAALETERAAPIYPDQDVPGEPGLDLPDL